MTIQTTRDGGTVYAADVDQLEVSHPDVYQQFMDGNFVVKATHKTFNQISTDMALEHVNKVGKVAGGLIGITRSDNARDKWSLTYNERSRIVDETSVMFWLNYRRRRICTVCKQGCG